MTLYEASLGGRDPLAALSETPDRIRELIGRMGTADFTRPLEPGKWNARQVLIHLAHDEMVFGVRVRFALASERYVVQPFDQDAFMAREPLIDAPAALAAYYAMRHWNLPLFRSLDASERAKTLHHPEQGEITIGMLVMQLAGHELHHLAQLEQIAGQAGT
jgi:uncharacterized damage-inducible protein DinB